MRSRERQWRWFPVVLLVRWRKQFSASYFQFWEYFQVSGSLSGIVYLYHDNAACTIPRPVNRRNTGLVKTTSRTRNRQASECCYIFCVNLTGPWWSFTVLQESFGTWEQSVLPSYYFNSFGIRLKLESEVGKILYEVFNHAINGKTEISNIQKIRSRGV